MGEWFSVPIKIFIVGILLALITSATWRMVETQAVYTAAQDAAHSAVTNTASYDLAAKNAATTVLPNSTVDSVQQVGNNLTQATVSYTPRDVASNVFSYLGVTSPNTTITMTGTAAGTLDTLTLAVPKTLSAGSTTSLTGSLLDGSGNPIANKTITLSTSSGMLKSSTVTTDSNGTFIVQYTAPNIITNVKITASGDNAIVSESIAIVANVTITKVSPALVGQTVTVQGVVTNGATGIANQLVTVSSDPTVVFSTNGTTTTNSNGDFTITFTAPSSAGIVNLVANCDGGYSNPPYSVTILAPAVNFGALQYSIGVDQDLTVSGVVKLAGNVEPNLSVTLSQSANLLNLSTNTTTTDANGKFSFSLPVNSLVGNEQLYASAGGGEGIVPIIILPAKIVFQQPSYQIGVTQPLTITGQITSANQNGVQTVLSNSGTQTINLSGITLGDFTSPSFGTSTFITTTNGVFSFGYQANETTGNDSIVGTDSSLSANGSTTVTIQSAQVNFAQSSYSTGMNQMLTVSGSVTSLNSSGNQSGVLGTQNVTLSVNPTIGSPFPETLTTSNGNFSTSFRMPNSPYSGSMTGTSLGGIGTTSIASNAPNVVVTGASTVGADNSETVTVNVNAGTGNNLEYQSVVLSTTGGSLSTPSGSTDVNGNFSTTFTAPTNSGTVTITATVDGSYIGTYTVGIAPVITSVSFNSGTWAPTVTVNGVGFGTPTGTTSGANQNQWIQLGDNNEGWQANSQNSGMIISEGTWNNTQIVTSGIGGYGNYGVWMMFPNDSLYINVTNPQTGSNTGQFNTSYPSNAQMPNFTGVSNNNVMAQPNQTATISGYLTLNGVSGGTPIPNAPVIISMSSGNLTSGSFATTSTTTNGNGYFSFTYTTPSNAGSGTFVLTTPTNPSAQGTAPINNGTYFVTGISASPTSVSPNGTTTITGTVQYNNGSSSWGWAGLPVFFTDTSGASQQNTTTGANGSFSYNFTVGPNGGTDTITVSGSWDSFSSNLTITLYYVHYWNYSVGSGNIMYENNFSLTTMASIPSPGNNTGSGTESHQGYPILNSYVGDGVWRWDGNAWYEVGGSNTVINTGILGGNGQHMSTTSVVELSNGDIVVGTNGNGMFQWDKASNTWNYIGSEFGSEYIYLLPDGQLLDGVSSFNGNANPSLNCSAIGTETSENVWSWTILPNEDVNATSGSYYNPEYFIGGFTETANGTIYEIVNSGAYSYANDCYVYQWNGSQFIHIGDFTNTVGDGIISLPNGNIVVGTNGLGVEEWNGSSWTNLGNPPQNPNSNLSAGQIFGLCLINESSSNFEASNSGELAEWNGSTWINPVNLNMVDSAIGGGESALF